MFVFAEHCDNQPDPAHYKDVVHKKLNLKNRKNRNNSLERRLLIFKPAHRMMIEIVSSLVRTPAGHQNHTAAKSY